MTTKECLIKILNTQNIVGNSRYSVLYGHNDGLYDNVNFKLIARFLKTDKINAYTQTNKIIIEF